MADDDNQEDRTEDPSDRKRQQAREKGNIPRSADFAGAFVLICAILLLYAFGSLFFEGQAAIMKFFINEIVDPPEVITTFQLRKYCSFIGMVLLQSSWFYWVGVFVAAIVANVIMVGFYASAEPLTPKFERLDLVKGLKQKFSLSTLNLLVQNLGKCSLISFAVYLVIKGYWFESLQSANIGMPKMIKLMFDGLFEISIIATSLLLAWSILDLTYQRWQHTRSIRMTKDEVKKEMKDMMGDPHIRQRRRQIQLNLARQSMMSQVQDADVVVTNPTFIAIALKYDEVNDSAPKVLAKGMRLTAEKIRTLAKEKGIPIVERKELAQELFKVCEIGDSIPENLFKAVAEVLAFVYQLGRKNK